MDFVFEPHVFQHVFLQNEYSSHLICVFIAKIGCFVTVKHTGIVLRVLVYTVQHGH